MVFATAPQGLRAVGPDRGITLIMVLAAGAVAGSLAASLLVGTCRPGAWFAVGIVLWGTPVALVAAVPHPAAALALPACVGVGNPLIDLGGFTLLARLASGEVLARRWRRASASDAGGQPRLSRS